MCEKMIGIARQGELPRKMLLDFAKTSERGRAWDGSPHKHGWGIGYSRKSFNEKDSNLEVIKSSRVPLWESVDYLERLLPEEVRVFGLHLRNAPEGAEIKASLNQPFWERGDNGRFCILINMSVKMRSFPSSIKLKGETGAQKVVNLLRDRLEAVEPEKVEDAFFDFCRYFTGRLAKKPNSLGIAAVDRKGLVLGYRAKTKYPESSSLFYLANEDFAVISGLALPSFGDWSELKEGEAISLRPDNTHRCIKIHSRW